MGLSSTQVRFSALTARNHDIAEELQHCALVKTSLTREMDRVSKKRMNALNSKVYKMSNNAGVSYTDLTYANLMRPGNANQNKPYLITNSENKIVIDDSYLKYAEMISPDGKPGGDWESNRTKILAELTGFSEAKISGASSSSATADAANAKVEALIAEKDTLVEPVSADTASQFFAKAGNVGSYNIGDLYNSSEWTNLGSNASSAKSTLTSILSGIASNMKNYLTDEDYAGFKSACDNYMNANGHYFGGTSENDQKGLESGASGIKLDGDNYTVNMKTVLDTILGGYEINRPNAYCLNNSGQKTYHTRNRQSSEWQNWNTKYQDWQTRYNAAIQEQNSAISADNAFLTAAEENLINFYDTVFTAIADKGWVHEPQVSDNSFLNQMLQNNSYFFTTVETETNNDGKEYLEYDTTLASNCSNLFAVKDDALIYQIEAEYEHEKNIINRKESQVDQKQLNLETEYSANKTILEGLQKIMQDNIDRTMDLYS